MHPTGVTDNLKDTKVRLAIKYIPTSDIARFSLREKDNCAANGSLIIYPRRAIALAHNPDAHSDDPALLLAMHGDQCVGYCVVVWDRVRFQGKVYRWTWGSQLYMLPDYRHSPVAILLLKRALFLADGWGAWNVTKEATKVFKALGAWEPCQVTIFRASARFSVESIAWNLPPQTHRLLRPFVALDKHSLLRWGRQVLHDLEVRATPVVGRSPIVSPPNELENGTAYFVRSKARLDWYLQFPWVRPEKQQVDEITVNLSDHPRSGSRSMHCLKLYLLVSANEREEGYVLVCHTQRNWSEPSRTCLLDWRFPRSDDRAFEAAVAVAAQSHLEAGTAILEIQAGGFYRAQATSIRGLRAIAPGPTFLAYCHKNSALFGAGIKEVNESQWKVGGAEGDQIPQIA